MRAIGSDMSESQRQPESIPADRLSPGERWKLAAVAFAFWAILTTLFGFIVAFAEPLEPLKTYPLDPTGWFVVRYDGLVVREATTWDMIRARYQILLFLAAYIAVIIFSTYVFVLGVRGKQNGLTRWVLKELSRESFRLSK